MQTLEGGLLRFEAFLAITQSTAQRWISRNFSDGIDMSIQVFSVERNFALVSGRA